MMISVCEQGRVDSLQDMLRTTAAMEGIQALMILACDANGFTPETVDPLLQACPLPVFGGIFPQIIARGTHFETGTVVVGLTHPVSCVSIPGLSDDQRDLEESVADALEGIDCQHKTVFVFVDGLSTRISAFIEGLFNVVGLIPNYIGGGAGSLSFEQKPCLFTPEGLLADAAVLGISDVTSGIGVAHGWHPVSETLKVTESEKNRVISLNWEPALQVYQKTIQTHTPVDFATQSFFDIAKAYPLGIVKLDAEMVVRDPILTENEALVCVGEVPVNSFIHILHGDLTSLVQGAVQSRDTALGNFQGDPQRAVLFFMDCISRVLFMGADFQKELQAVDVYQNTFGALTIGEIANVGDAYLEFYNKTAVSGILGDPCDP